MEPPSNSPSNRLDLNRAIRRRAEEIYYRNGEIPGHDLDNWAQAESEILNELSSPRRNAIVVRIDGVSYTGEYNPTASDGYTPGEFRPGAPVPVRVDGDRMVIIRRNGKELETTIVQKQA
jgi:hypothetical protein